MSEKDDRILLYLTDEPFDITEIQKEHNDIQVIKYDLLKELIRLATISNEEINILKGYIQRIISNAYKHLEETDNH